MDTSFHKGWLVSNVCSVAMLFQSFSHSVIQSFSQSFSHSFLHSFIPSFLHSFIPSFLPSFVRSFSRSVVQSLFIHSFLHSFIPCFLRSFIRSFIRSVVHSFIRFFVSSFLRSFIHSFIHTYTDTHTYIHTHTHICSTFFACICCWTMWVWEPITLPKLISGRGDGRSSSHDLKGLSMSGRTRYQWNHKKLSFSGNYPFWVVNLLISYLCEWRGKRVRGDFRRICLYI